MRPRFLPSIVALLVAAACSSEDGSRRRGGSPEAGADGRADAGTGGAANGQLDGATDGGQDATIDVAAGGASSTGGTSSADAASGGAAGADASAGGAASTGGGTTTGGTGASLDAATGGATNTGGTSADASAGGATGADASPDAAPDAPLPPPCVIDPALAPRRDACEFAAGALASDTIGACTGSSIPIEHIVIIMQENRSFDHYYGHLPGNGQDDVDVATTQTNPNPLGGAPIPWHHETAYCIADTNHGWNGSHTQWNGGLNDGFTSTNTNAADPTGSRAMGYYDQTDLPFYYSLASTFAISDRYFCSLLGPTYPNRMFGVAGTSFGVITTSLTKLAPAGVPSLYRQLTDRGITWKNYYSDLPSTALFFDYYSALSQTAPEHFVASTTFVTDAASGTLPQVSFLDADFIGEAYTQTDEHPPADIQLGQHWVWEQIQAVLGSPQWPKTAVFFTYDEHGGLYDHVSPPPACVPDSYPPDPTINPAPGGFDRLGFRVPFVLISPYARRHFVSHEVHSHSSMLRFIQAKFDLPAMTARDANSDALLDLFDFASPPNLSVPSFPEPPVDAAQLAACQAAFP